MDLVGKRALVTGASSGIGESFARLLAARGARLVVTARRAERLEALAEALREAHGTEVVTIPLDLSESEAPLTLFERTEGAGLPVDILINNAGFGTRDLFRDIPWERSAEQLRLNVVALTELTKRFLGPMLERGEGWILNVSSIAAYFPVPAFATYAAGKSYVRSFTVALAHELRATPVRVCCLCPGGTRTEFMEVAGQEVTALVRAASMSPERCARIGLRALLRGRRNIVSGLMNSLLCWLSRFVPERVLTFGANLVLGK